MRGPVGLTQGFLGRDCLADVAVLRAEPGVFGLVASDLAVSGTIDHLAQDPTAALAVIDTARAAARAQAWRLAGDHAPGHGVAAGSPLIIDVDATLVTAHSVAGVGPVHQRCPFPAQPGVVGDVFTER